MSSNIIIWGIIIKHIKYFFTTYFPHFLVLTIGIITGYLLANNHVISFVEVKNFLKYIFSLLTKWPIVALIVFFNLKTPLKNLIGRIIKITHGSTTTHFGQEIPNEEKGLEKAKEKEITSNTKTYEVKKQGQVLNNQIEAIKKDLNSLLPDNKKNRNKREDILIHELAGVQLEFLFERIYRVIYDSQLDALDKLNTRSSVTKNYAQKEYQRYIEIIPELKQISFDTWKNFLVNVGLIIEQNESFSITAFGIKFLEYLTVKGYSRIKGTIF